MEARAGEVFVGRRRELGELERALNTTRAGSGATVLIAGEAGIGKTRLASELASRARDAGFEVLLGRSIDLVGTELPYQPFVEALHSLGEPRRAEGQAPGSQLAVFEVTLALLTERAAAAPVLLVLEDLHWADVSTLDLVVFLAHNVEDRPVLLLATYRADERSSAERMRRLANAVRRSSSVLALELAPLERDELTALLGAQADASLPATVADAILARSEGNPFFAEELLAAAGDSGSEIPLGLRELLLQRVARLDDQTQGMLRVAASAGREVGYPLLYETVALPEHDLRDSLRQAVEHGVLVADQETSSFRFRHALLAEAIYSTVLPGEREELHVRLAEELARSGAAGAAELAPHWAAAGCTEEALVASVEAAHQTEAAFGLAEALAHLERALALWEAVPNAAELVKVDLAELCSWAAELASQAGAAPRAVDLAQRAIDLVEKGDPLRAARLHDRLGRYLHESGRTDAALSAFERVIELVPAEPPSPERAQALAALAHGLMLAWRFDESLTIGEQAVALARAVGAHGVERRALLDFGRDLAYLGRADEGVGCLRRALELAEENGDPAALLHAYISLTDVLTMLGRPGESSRVGERGLEVVRRYGIDSTVLVANTIEALLAIGEWDEADRASAAALRAITANFPYMLFGLRADIEIGRGDFEDAKAHLKAALATMREDRGQGIYDVFLAELALWERRWMEADEAVRDGLARASSRQAAQLRVWFCAKGLRAQAELAALARARRDADAARTWLARAQKLIGVARHAAAEASAVTPNAGGWLALAEAEYQRAGGVAQPESWSEAAWSWEQLERPPLVAYCRWRQAEALIAAGAPRTEASVPLREAHAVATRIGAKPLLRELELLAQRARVDLASPETASSKGKQDLEEILGLTPREAEVLTLVARGYTNREIAAALVISVKTASVHVSHILRKLDAPNRLEAATIAHRVTQPHSGSGKSNV
jgi:DNA-binding CsgD family transcriptional regulator/tetratricopeptide (TPR) repeat protein